MDDNKLRQYANMAVRMGVNIQPGQTLLINAPIYARDLARHCAQAAYDAGAREVVVFYNDEKLTRMKMENASVETLCDVKPWIANSYLEYIKGEGSAAVLSITGSDPELLKGLDTAKIQQYSVARSKAMEEYYDYTMASRIQWCVIAVPSPAWAKRVFPDLREDAAVEKLWDTIFKVSRVEGDAVANWSEFARVMGARRDRINELKLSELHITSSNGTDLYVGLRDDNIWGGVDEVSQNGYVFIPNMPTEEIFTAPHRDKVNGVAHITKPYVYNGDLIEDFTLWFENGKVVRYEAKKGEDLLKQLLETDEGSCRLGEVALVPASSPINREGVLFYNTLFDENAACHIALGRGYPTTVKGGEDMTTEELLAKGVNDSNVHEDVMIGYTDTEVIGTTRDGKTVQIFKDGEWVF